MGCTSGGGGHRFPKRASEHTSIAMQGTQALFCQHPPGPDAPGPSSTEKLQERYNWPYACQFCVLLESSPIPAHARVRSSGRTSECKWIKWDLEILQERVSKTAINTHSSRKTRHIYKGVATCRPGRKIKIMSPQLSMRNSLRDGFFLMNSHFGNHAL